ncbi:MAG: copper resistance CopC/CopD family protein [Bacillus sp. (in: firmicutes)]
MRRQYKALFSCILTICLLSITFHVFGHSSPISSSPAPNSKLKQPPTHVIIKFDSEIDDNLYSLKVYNEQQEEVTVQQGVLDSTQTELSVPLSHLPDGYYTVKYNVVAKDGHPLQGTYAFSVGIVQLNSIATEPTMKNFDSTSLIMYIIRALYYFGLLWIVGWVVWSILLSQKGKAVPQKFTQWGFIAQMIHLFGLVSMILVQIIDITDSGWAFNPEISLTSVFGLSWVGSLCLSLLGVILLFRSIWIDLLWLLVLLILKGLNGHSSDFEPVSLIVGLNTLHLVGASLWCAGLIFIIVYWKKQRLHVYEFLPLFSHYALLSFIVLALSGTALSIIYLPNFHALFSTEWGWILVAKIILVLFVAIVGAIIRKKMKTTLNGRLKVFLLLDFILMVLIIGIVSVLTYI